MVHSTAIIVALKTVGLVVGGLITYFSYKAYRRTNAPALRALTLGFGLVTLGALIAGVVDQVLTVDQDVALIIESLFTVVGFGVILYSLYVE